MFIFQVMYDLLFYDRKFYIEDTNPTLFAIFIRYLYTFDVDFTDINTGDMMELMSIADRYEVRFVTS